MLAVGSAILLGAASLLAFAFLKLVFDIKCRAAASAKQSFDEHFELAGKFIDDPASPIELSNLLIKFSAIIIKESAGRKALELIVSDPENKPLYNYPVDSSMGQVESALNVLERHRPDLTETFRKSVSCGFLGAAYGQVVREISPVRAFQENQETKQAKRRNRSDESVARALSTLIDTNSAKPA